MAASSRADCTPGKCVEVHKLFYSIGRAGKYKLHIGLRHRASRCLAHHSSWVVPGPASAITTMVPRGLTLKGDVGKGEEGCRSRCAATTLWATGASRAARR